MQKGIYMLSMAFAIEHVVSERFLTDRLWSCYKVVANCAARRMIIMIRYIGFTDSTTSFSTLAVGLYILDWVVPIFIERVEIKFNLIVVI